MSLWSTAALCSMIFIIVSTVYNNNCKYETKSQANVHGRSTHTQGPRVRCATCAVHHWERISYSQLFPPFLSLSHCLSPSLTPSLRYGPPYTERRHTHTHEQFSSSSSSPPLLSVYGDQKYAELKDREGLPPYSVFTPPPPPGCRPIGGPGWDLLSVRRTAHSAQNIVPPAESTWKQKLYISHRVLYKEKFFSEYVYFFEYVFSLESLTRIDITKFMFIFGA
jgi:hypothetical protein